MDAAGIDAVTQHLGNVQHHIFFTRAARADGPRVFTAVAWVQGHHDQSVGAILGGRTLGAPRVVHVGVWRRLNILTPC